MNAAKQLAVNYQQQKIECQQLVVELMTSNNMSELDDAVASLEQYKKELSELTDEGAPMTYESMAKTVGTIVTVYNSMQERDKRDYYGCALMRDWHTLVNKMSDIREGYLSHSHFAAKQYRVNLVSGIDNLI